MKKILILLTILTTFFCINAKEVYAATNFYEAERINNIYMTRTNGARKIYQQARFLRRKGDDQPAYCIQPFIMFQADGNYDQTTNPSLTPAQQERIKDIVHFGYLYPNHYEAKWYPITQMMIWQSIEAKDNFYFTDTLNGNKINAYRQEMNEIEQLIQTSKLKPSFNNQIYHTTKGTAFSLVDQNNVLNQYYVQSGNATISNNTLIFNTDNFTNETVTLIRKDQVHNTPLLFYYGNNTQELLTLGNRDQTSAQVTVTVDEVKLKIKKTTEDDDRNKEGNLQGAIFTLYNENYQKLIDLTLDENLEATITNQDIIFQYNTTYYIKETTAGTGYLLDDTYYPITFKENKKEIELTIKNDLIKREITLQKYLTDNDKTLEEEGAVFEIYNKNGEKVETITTDVTGKATITLPFGHYIIKQIKGKENYELVKPFEIMVNDQQSEYFYKLYDEKINQEITVPHTGIKKKTKSNVVWIILLSNLYIITKKEWS